MVFVSGTRILHRVILQTTTALIAQCQPVKFYIYPNAAQDIITVQGTRGVKKANGPAIHNLVKYYRARTT